LERIKMQQSTAQTDSVGYGKKALQLIVFLNRVAFAAAAAVSA
jgi:hypothetical protein